MAEKIYDPRRPRRGTLKHEEREEEKKAGDSFDDVQALIRKEAEAAIALFRQTDFDRRIKARIEADSRPKKKIPRLRPFPFPSPIQLVAAALLVLLITVPMVLYLVSPSEAEREFRELRDYFAQVRTPGSINDEQPSLSSGSVSPEYAALEEHFKRTLYTVYLRHQDITADNLPGILDKVLFNVPLPEEGEIITITYPRNLEERIKTMIEEKQVYKALSKAAQKT